MNPYGWIGAGLVLLGMWLTGNRRRVGFLVGVVAEGFWLTYSVMISSLELGLMSLVFVGVYLRNYWAWRE